MTWDWSNAGEKNDEGKPFQTKNDAGQVVYDSKKGTFTWEANVTPYYTWWNGETRYLTPTDTIDPSAPVIMTGYQGSLGDGKIYPFKSRVTGVVSSRGNAGQDDLGQRIRLVGGGIIAYGTTTAINEGAEIYFIAWKE